LSGNKWTIVINVSLKQHIDTLLAIPKHLKLLTETFENRTRAQKSDDEFKRAVNKDILSVVSNEAKLAELGVMSLLKIIQEIESELLPQNYRQKRSLFDGGGHVLKFLFGTAETSDIKGLNERINTLQGYTGRMAHLMNEQATLLNLTYQSAGRNAEGINRLVNATDLL
jgi:Baculovirus F protein